VRISCQIPRLYSDQATTNSFQILSYSFSPIMSLCILTALLSEPQSNKRLLLEFSNHIHSQLRAIQIFSFLRIYFNIIVSCKATLSIRYLHIRFLNYLIAVVSVLTSGQQIRHSRSPRLVQNQQAHNRIHKSQKFFSAVNQKYSVFIRSSYSYKT
jgi:hypothetical protein